MIKVTPEQQLGFLQRDVLPLIKAIRDGFEYDPGHSDLDNEQPIVVRMSLGDYRRADRLYFQLRGQQ